MTVIGRWYFPELISAHKTFTVQYLSCSAEEKSDRGALVGTWHPARVTHPTTGKPQLVGKVRVWGMTPCGNSNGVEGRKISPWLFADSLVLFFFWAIFSSKALSWEHSGQMALVFFFTRAFWNLSSEQSQKISRVLCSNTSWGKILIWQLDSTDLKFLV